MLIPRDSYEAKPAHLGRHKIALLRACPYHTFFQHKRGWNRLKGKPSDYAVGRTGILHQIWKIYGSVFARFCCFPYSNAIRQHFRQKNLYLNSMPIILHQSAKTPCRILKHWHIGGFLLETLIPNGISGVYLGLKKDRKKNNKGASISNPPKAADTESHAGEDN